ncbi:hypothetical protein RM574_19180 [Streptomyces sp. DSM 41982]|uniref:Phage protein n=1 Tax=Streptomyces evansiae TaxID=3075535 RepID=A0ABD5E989_9ACTN|nr:MULTISPECIES: hypothetical protein [unclassified Streptomyces]MDT0417611.1 hypothetical protein [Streptomyces sp. DSM 41982]SCE27451.1 hypothetical protein GA0115246_113586 [Streptomyces sp. SolWspMP-sol7th]
MGFSGINPDKLAKTISSLDSDQKELRGSVSWIKSSFGQYGIDTEPLVQLGGIASWAEDQLPGLRRRLHLSIAEHTQYGVKGYVRIDEAKVGAAKQSVADGKKAGEKWKDQIEKGDISPEVFATLTANSADADYLKGFYDALGPQALSMLSLSMGDHMNERYKDDPKQREEDRKVLADTFGTYTRVAFEGKTAKQKQKAWNDWFDGMKDGRDLFRPDLLTPLLPGGKQDKDFLVALGDRVFDSKNGKNASETQWMGKNSGMSAGEWGKDSYAQLFQAIANNDEASGEWTDHNFDFVEKALYPAGPWRVDEPKERGEAFLSVLNAGAVKLHDTNPRLAEKNVAHLLFANHKHATGDMKGVAAIDGTSALFTSIITANFQSMSTSIASPVADQFWKGDKWDYAKFLKSQDLGLSGVEVSPDLWSDMMVEAAKDAQGAGTISSLFAVQQERLGEQIESIRPGKGSEDMTRWLSAKQGFLDGFYADAMNKAEKSHKDDIDQWIADTNSFRDGVIDQVTGVAAGGLGGAGVAGVKGAAVGAIYGLATDTATGLLKDAFHVSEKDVPKDMMTDYKKMKAQVADTSWQATYRDIADRGLKHGYDKVAYPDVTYRPVELSQDNHNVLGDPKSESAAPKVHSEADNFLNKDGSVKPIEKMTPSQRTAYGEWLEKPAVVNNIWGDLEARRNVRDWGTQGKGD